VCELRERESGGDHGDLGDSLLPLAVGDSLPADMASSSLLQRWRVTFWASFDSKFSRLHDGFLVLKPFDASILLLSKDEKLVDHICAEEGEIIQSGRVISFPCHYAHVCEEILFEKPQAPASALAPGLNFSHGIAFEANVKKSFWSFGELPWFSW
jgi:hypothetical protein